MGNVETILDKIAEVLKVLYKWPKIFAVTNGYVEVLLKARTLWFKYDEPLGNVDFALMYEGISEDSGEPVELRFIEVALRHVESTKILLSFLDEPQDFHLYEAIPTGPVVKAYAKIENSDLIFTDVTQLKQFIAQRLKTLRKNRAM
jgi:hypothetical protein